MTKDYCQGIEYKDGKVEAVYGQEGRLTAVYDQYGVTLTRFRAEYWLKDHLGNPRLAFADDNHNGTIEVWDDPSTPENEAEITQENHYYPFGMNQEGPWYATIGPRNGYQYNGKELNEELELGWNDFGARWQDPSIGRFAGVDALAELSPDWTPYRYAYNNPLRYSDPFGLTENDEIDRQIQYDDKGNPTGVHLYYSSNETSNSSNTAIFFGFANSDNGSSRNSSINNFSDLPSQTSLQPKALFVQNRLGQEELRGGPPWEYNGKMYDTESELYWGIMLDKAAEQFGVKDLAALTGIIGGLPLIKKRFVTAGTSTRTSILSSTIGKAGKTSARLPTITMKGLKYTTSIGRFASRWIPLIGWGVLGYDLIQVYRKTEDEYNRITRH